MTQTMAIRLSEGPADRLVRLHTEHPDWDEPEVRYLRRRDDLPDRVRALRLHDPDGSEEIVLAFGDVHVCICADDDHIRIAVCEKSTPTAA